MVTVATQKFPNRLLKLKCEDRRLRSTYSTGLFWWTPFVLDQDIPSADRRSWDRNRTVQSPSTYTAPAQTCQTPRPPLPPTRPQSHLLVLASRLTWTNVWQGRGPRAARI
ncbi:hypothetical protein Q5P01_016743 [Channa striata]|uniref:Uncharacterized protein n=1 Tax=Channa striata TaxID=64152 RepID=A0AA88M836_CHASR|nr:hypothetical protein Q5P01_016743 [Channa striata]